MLYRLKRNFGEPLTFRQPNVTTQNVETGVITRTYNDTIVKRAIVMPVSEARKYDYGSTISRAGKVAYGALFDQLSRFVIVDKKDLPTVDLQWHVVFNSDRYEVSNILDYRDDRAYYLLIKRLTSQ